MSLVTNFLRKVTFDVHYQQKCEFECMEQRKIVKLIKHIKGITKLIVLNLHFFQR